MGMANFSFNKPDGACPTCTGLGFVQQANIDRLIDKQKSIPDGAIAGWDIHYINYQSTTLRAAARYYQFDLDLSIPIKDYSPTQYDLLLFGVDDLRFQRHFPDKQPPSTVMKGRFEGIATNLLRRYAERIQDAEYREKMEEFLVTEVCSDCAGTRLKPESRVVTVNNQTIIAVSRISLTELLAWLEKLPETLTPDENRIAGAILSDLDDRINRLIEVGAGYLTLERSSPSISAGEAQRLRLASLLGSGLTGVLYVFDEPTIGLHQRDTHRLINVLCRLRDLGNTVLVIEHDLDVIASADWIIDFGPGAGKHGGQVVAFGTPSEIVNQVGSKTADYMAGRTNIPIPDRRRKPNGKEIVICGARHHNLKNITVKFPLGLFVAISGVSGSGKSSLVFDILDRSIRKQLYGANVNPGDHDRIEGMDQLDKIITINQEHIGRIPRSNTATYSDVFTHIRKAFADSSEAKQLGLSPRHFSFNVQGGRCDRCEGTGFLSVKMHFLPDVDVRCPVCHGRRFKREILAVRYKNHDISQVLDLTIDEALGLFQEIPAARSRLQVLSDVGLGYLTLGQPATTLSGGEAQRVKLAKELGRRVSGKTLYLLDEPTTGLHLADTAKLLDLLQRLVDAGNTVIVVEHNLDFIKAADWVIDLGPEGGEAGGQLIAEGTPEQIAKNPVSFTGQWLKQKLLLETK
jgi:excinuclease ABC subunit A